MPFFLCFIPEFPLTGCCVHLGWDWFSILSAVGRVGTGRDLYSTKDELVYHWGKNSRGPLYYPGSAFIKPNQLDPWIKDQIKIILLPPISHLQLPNFVSFGNCRCEIVDNRAFPSWSLIHGLRWSGLIKAEPGLIDTRAWISNFTNYLTHLPLEKMAASRIGDKPLSEPRMTRFTDAYMRHYGGMS